MLSDKEIKNIALLARINVSDKEIEQAKNKLSSVLDYINQLNEVNTDNVEPVYQTTGLVNSLRDDSKISGIIGVGGLIEQAPRHEKEYVKVRAVIDKNK